MRTRSGQKADGSLRERYEEIVRQRKEHLKVSEIARIHGVSRQSIHTLLKIAREKGETFPKKPKPTKACPACGREFPGKSQHCSRACGTESRRREILENRPKWSRIATTDLQCSRCGKDFKRTLFQNQISNIGVKEGKRDYCGQECYREHMRENNDGRRARVAEESQKMDRPDASEIARRLRLEGVHVSREFVKRTIGASPQDPGYKLWRPGRRKTRAPDPLRHARDFVKKAGSLDEALRLLHAIGTPGKAPEGEQHHGGA